MLKWGASGTGIVSLRAPQGLAIDAAGNGYVADTAHHRVLKVNSAGTVLETWGSFGSGDGQFNSPSDVALDSSGNVYVADTYNHRIQKLTAAGAYTTQWGGFGTGNGQFNVPRGVTLDALDNVYVADTNNHRVQKFSSSGGYTTKWGAFGSGNGQFKNPRDISADTSGGVYVADTNNHRVQKFTSGGAYLLQWGANGTGSGEFDAPAGITANGAGDVVYVSDTNNHRIQKFTFTTPPDAYVFSIAFGSNGDDNGKLASPAGLALDSAGNLYVADVANNRVQKFDAAGTYVSKWSAAGSGNGQFYNPVGITVSPSGEVYVADTFNHRNQKFTLTGTYAAKWGIFGTVNGRFRYPRCVAVDSLGNIYVVDEQNNRVQKFNASRVFQSSWGTFGSGNGQFDAPFGIAIDASDSVYVTDSGNQRVQKFSSAGAYILQWGTAGTGDGQFQTPLGIATDASSNVYVADSGNDRVQKFSSTGVFVTKWGSHGAGNSQFDTPSGVVADNAGDIFVADTQNHRIQKFTPDGAYLTQWGTLGDGNGQFYAPQGVAADATGAVFVSDSGNHRIQKFVPGLPAPIITEPNEGDDFSTTSAAPVTLGGTCDSSSAAIHVNGGSSGVAYTPGTADWSYTSGALVPGPNTFDVTAYNGVAESAADSITITYTPDATPPGVALASTAPNPTNITPIPVTVTFTETVSGFTSGDIVPANASVSNFSGSGASYAFDLTPAGQGAVTANIAAGVCTDLAGNPNSAAAPFSRTYDSVGPAITLGSPAPGTVNAAINVSVALTEATSDFAAADVTLENATLSGFSGSGSSYSFTLTPLEQGPFSAAVAEDRCTDALGNGNSASNLLSRNYDSEGPAVTLSSTAPASVNAAISVSVVLDETSGNFTSGDIAPVNATVSGFGGSGTNYSFTLTPQGQGVFSAAVAAGKCTDGLGNPSSASNVLSRTYDSVSPQLTLSSTAGPSVTGPISITVTLTEETNFSEADISVTNGSPSSFSGSGTSFSFMLAPSAQGVFSARVTAGACSDIAGNPNVASNVLSRTYDTIGPVITLSSTAPTVVHGPIVVTAALNEASGNFAVSDITADNAAVSGFSGTGLSYNFTLTPSAEGVFSAAVNAGRCTDALGNPNSASNVLTRNFSAYFYTHFSYVGPEDGSLDHPYNTLAEGVAAATPNGTVLISGPAPDAVSTEHLVIDDPCVIDTAPGITAIIGVNGSLLLQDTLAQILNSAPASTTANLLEDLMRRLALRGLLPASEPPPTDIFAPVMPFATTPDGRQRAAINDVLAIRLRPGGGNSPARYWTEMPADLKQQTAVRVVPANGDTFDDVWVLFEPKDTWLLDDVMRLAAGAEAFSGGQRAQFDFEVSEDAPSETSVSAVQVIPGDAGMRAPLLAGGLDTPVSISPQQIFETPQRIWLPVPKNVDPQTLHLYYYHPIGDKRGWYPAEVVDGWLVKDSYVLLEQDGSTWCGFDVRHAAIMQLATEAGR